MEGKEDPIALDKSNIDKLLVLLGPGFYLSCSRLVDAKLMSQSLLSLDYTKCVSQF